MSASSDSRPSRGGRPSVDFALVRALTKEIPDAKCVVLPTAFWRTAPQSDRGDSEMVHLICEVPRSQQR